MSIGYESNNYSDDYIEFDPYQEELHISAWVYDDEGNELEGIWKLDTAQVRKLLKMIKEEMALSNFSLLNF